MAILSAILSLLAKQLSNILQAIFGWSITALFGRLPAQKQTALSVALILSIAWPLLVVGCFLPGVAAWALAFLPLQKWMSATALRIVWIVLALLVPIGVGAVTRWITPPQKLHGSALRTLLGGYLLTIGYFLAFLMTAVTVPIVKVLSTAKGWSDVHVYLQPKSDRYFDVLMELQAACNAAGADVKRERVTGAMALSTRVIKLFARGIVDPIVPADPQRLRGEELEVYLYPADLLLRGDAHVVARVRAAMTRSMVQRFAYLAQEPEAQTIEDELQDMWDLVARHEGPREIGDAAADRLRAIAKELDESDVAFDDWVTLEMSLRRVERAVAGEPRIIDAQLMPDTHVALERTREHTRGAKTKDLVEGALAEARRLIALEIALAKQDARRELKEAATASALLGAAAIFEVLALVALAAVITAALVKVLVLPIVIGVALFAVAAGAAVFGVKHLPKEVLAGTRGRIAEDAAELRDRVG